MNASLIFACLSHNAYLLVISDRAYLKKTGPGSQGGAGNDEKATRTIRGGGYLSALSRAVTDTRINIEMGANIPIIHSGQEPE